MHASKALEALLHAELKRGFFTAFAVECGCLDEPQPRYRVSQVPDAAVFDLASLTKALATGPLVFKAFSKHKKAFATPLRDVATGLPEAFGRLSLQELLAHRSGLPAWWNFWMPRLQEGPLPSHQDALAHIAKVFARIPAPQEKRDLYSDLGYILLGYALEQHEGKDIGALFSDLKRELGVEKPCERLGFAPALGLKAEDFVPSAFCKLRNRLLQGEVHDENSAALGGLSGHAGLFGSLTALGPFLKALYASPLGRAYLDANQAELPKHGFEGLLGMRRGNGLSAGLFCEGQGMGHLGFTGTAFWLHLPSKKYAIFLSNRVMSGRVSPHIGPLRREVFGHLHDILLS